MNVTAEYVRFRDACRKLNPPQSFLNFCDLFADKEIWKSYEWLINLTGGMPKDCVAVDIGCKFGHTMPLFLLKGATSAIGVDIVDEYIDGGRTFTQHVYPQISFVKPERGYLPIATESVAFVMINEAISHVNPTQLPLLYSEIARILKTGGKLIISDGNNIANAECRADLLKNYTEWERGKPGHDTGRDVIEVSYEERRRRLIGARHPNLAAEKVDYLARNTSGLYGDYFFEIVDRFVATGDLIERPFRPGTCPTHPVDGAVMEFGFDPRLVELQLADYGIEAHQIDERVPPTFDSFKSLIASLVIRISRAIERRTRPDAYRGVSWGFQIVGVKK